VRAGYINKKEDFVARFSEKERAEWLENAWKVYLAKVAFIQVAYSDRATRLDGAAQYAE
jgi:hypothetical protein